MGAYDGFQSSIDENGSPHQRKGVVTFEELQRATGAAPATVKRDIRYMREELKAPITFSRIRGGYLFAKNRAEAKRDDFYDRRSMWLRPMSFTAW